MTTTSQVFIAICRSERNAQESPLLKLPGELRNKIWNYVLGDRTLHIEHTAANDLTAEGERPRDLTNRGLSLCCLRVCRQIYTEARHLPYSSNTFAFRNTSTYQFFTPSLLPKQRRLITKLNLLVTDVLINSDEQLHWGAWSRAIPSAPLLGDLITDLHINHDISYKKSYVLKTIGPISAPGPPAYLELRFQVMRAMGLSPNCKITSIVADTAKSAWSYQSWPRMPIELRYSRFGGSERRWRRLREHGCLTVGEKRQITIWINKVCGTKRGHKGRDKPSDDE
ncbi:hypothetical protein AOQ84DRAFT_336894 [Glonium stellatum]|uniref:DUF7730 domain-containing protein n=1 Tax=Glonium stellatum TaxID=574774 RepID=A0A8E2F5P0_9PEZI|nr:hypothetical protein AOQ84DRAFT_336894 [Glonium stellatum]